jgi:hypothetical protein
MDDPFFMRGFKRLRDLPGDTERLIQRDRPTRNPLVQRLAVMLEALIWNRNVNLE